MLTSISKITRRSKRADRPRRVKPFQPDSLERRLLLSFTADVFGNVRNDVNDTGTYNASDAGLAGWTVYIDVNNNGKLDSGEPSAVTNSSGAYSINGSVPAEGEYPVEVNVQSGWRITYPSSEIEWIGVTSTSCVFTNVNFEATQKGLITGTVFNDPNGDGAQERGEQGISGLQVTVTDQTNGNVGPWTATTASNGTYTVRDLPGGDTFAPAVSNPPATDVPGWLTEQPGGGAMADGTLPAVTVASGTSQSVSFPEYRTLPAPTALTAAFGSGGTDHTTVDLSWTSNSAGLESGFHVYESINGGAFTLAATLAQGTTSTVFTGLSATSDYVFKVAAYDGNTTSADSTGDSYLSSVADAAAPPAPSLFDSSGNPIESWAQNDSTSGRSVTLNWSDPNAPAGTTYKIYRSTVDVQPTTVYATSTTTSYQDNSVTAGTTYYYWFSGVNSGAPGASAGTPGPEIVVPGPNNTISYFEPVVLQLSKVLDQHGHVEITADSVITIPGPPAQHPNAQVQSAVFAYTVASMGMASGLVGTADVGWDYSYWTIVNGVVGPATDFNNGSFSFDANHEQPQGYWYWSPAPYPGAPSTPPGSQIDYHGDLALNMQCDAGLVLGQTALGGFYGITYAY